MRIQIFPQKSDSSRFYCDIFHTFGDDMFDRVVEDVRWDRRWLRMSRGCHRRGPPRHSPWCPPPAAAAAAPWRRYPPPSPPSPRRPPTPSQRDSGWSAYAARANVCPLPRVSHHLSVHTAGNVVFFLVILNTVDANDHVSHCQLKWHSCMKGCMLLLQL